MRRLLVCAVLPIFLLAAACGDEDGDDPNGGPDAGTEDGGAFDSVEATFELSLPGQQGRVEVLRDPNGAPHVFCQHDADCIRAQGWLQAHDRLFQLDFNRRLAGGRLASAVGTISPAIRDSDRFYRRMFTAPDGRSVVAHMEETLDPTIRELLEAFSEGINAYLADLGEPWAPVSPEYGHPLVLGGADILAGNAAPPEWTLEDTLLVARFFTHQLSEGSAEEIGLATSVAAFGADAPEMFPVRQLDETFVVPGFYEQPGVQSRALTGPGLSPEGTALLARSAPALRSAHDMLEGIRPFLKPFGEEAGSNNWLVDGAHSATGHPLVANDPHLQLLTPSVWWQVHLDAVSMEGAQGTLKVAGVIFPGTPGVIIGHGADVAWGVTVTGYDVTDVYVEEVTAVDTVRFQGADVAVEKALVRFPTGPGEDQFDEEKICYVPHHGPLVYPPPGTSAADFADPDLPCVDPAVSTTALSIRWTGQEPSHELQAAFGVFQAQTIAEAREALRHFEVGAQNWIIADTAGDVTYYPHAHIPVRGGDLSAHPPWLPMPGTGEYEWTGRVPDEAIPQVTNPEVGFVVTANQDIAGVTADGDPLDDPYYLYYTRANGLRGGRITRLLQQAMEDDGTVSVEEMEAIQNDSYYEFAEYYVPHLLAAADAAPEEVTALGLEDAISRLRAWTFAAPTGLSGWDPTGLPSEDPQERNDAIATTIFSTWIYEAIDATFLDEYQAAGLVAASATAAPAGELQQKALHFQLEGTDDRFFDDVSTPDVTETRAQTLLRALAASVELISANEALGPDPENWLWGRVHVVPLPSTFGTFGAEDRRLPLGPVANDGGLHAVDVAGFGRSYAQGSGPSMRHVTEVSPDGMTMRYVIPGGVVDLAGNPNRGDQLPLWLEGEYLEPPFDLEGAVQAAGERAGAGVNPGARLTFTPAP